MGQAGKQRHKEVTVEVGGDLGEQAVGHGGRWVVSRAGRWAGGRVGR